MPVRLQMLMGAGAPLALALASVPASVEAGAVVTLAAAIPAYGAAVIVSLGLGWLIHRQNMAVIELVRMRLLRTDLPAPRSAPEGTSANPSEEFVTATAPTVTAVGGS